MSQKQAGTYYGRLVETGVDTINNDNKTPFIYLNFEVTHFSSDGQWIESEAFNRDVKMFISDKSWPYTEKDLNSIGFNGDFNNPIFRDELYKGAELICSHKNYDNKVYEEWSLSCLDAPRQRKAPAAEVLEKFNARWGTNDSAKQPPSNSQPAEQSYSDDEIPY